MSTPGSSTAPVTNRSICSTLTNMSLEGSNSTPRDRFTVKKLTTVAYWAWDIQVDNCAICRNHIMDLCIECQANLSNPVNPEKKGEKTVCNVAFGTCNHAFHFHCISRWLKTRMVCPLDNRDWAFKKYGMN